MVRQAYSDRQSRPVGSQRSRAIPLSRQRIADFVIAYGEIVLPLLVRRIKLRKAFQNRQTGLVVTRRVSSRR